MRYAIASLLLTVFPGGALAQSLNVSDFVFRDMDGDGRYELEDFPYAGANLVARLNDNIVTTTSNLNGFANFVMSDTDQGADFVESGSGVVTYTPPPGMFISTARSSVPFEVVRVEGSIAGFAVDPPFPFLGLAIAPRVAVHATDAVSLTCSHDGHDQTVPFDATDFAVCTIPTDEATGPWALNLVLQDGRTVSLDDLVPGYRSVVMSVFPDAQTGDPGPLNKVTFDDVQVTRDVREMPSLADGLTFHNFVSAHRRFYGGAGYVNAVTSGEYLAYTSSGHPGTISKEGGFVPVSMQLGYAWDGAGAGLAVIEAYRDGALVQQVSLNLTTGYPTTFMPRWGRVDRLVIRHTKYWQVLVDDFTYAE